jgi:hypothetical protein
MRPQARAARIAWNTYWNAMRVYHRFEVVGLEHIVGRQGSVLVVGYHGRPWALDLCMLGTLLEREHGVELRPIFHQGFEQPGLNWLIEGLGCVTSDGPRMAEVVARGDPVVVTPGASREGFRPFYERYRVSWGGRMGYLRLALKYKMPLVLAASAGVDDTYIGLNDGEKWGQRLKLPTGLPAWIGVGPLGVWPLSPPFPSKITLHLSPPIHLEDNGPVNPEDTEQLRLLHRDIATRIQRMLDNARNRSVSSPGQPRPPPPEPWGLPSTPQKALEEASGVRKERQ